MAIRAPGGAAKSGSGGWQRRCERGFDGEGVSRALLPQALRPSTTQDDPCECGRDAPCMCVGRVLPALPLESSATLATAACTPIIVDPQSRAAAMLALQRLQAAPGCSLLHATRALASAAAPAQLWATALRVVNGGKVIEHAWHMNCLAPLPLCAAARRPPPGSTDSCPLRRRSR